MKRLNFKIKIVILLLLVGLVFSLGVKSFYKEKPLKNNDVSHIIKLLDEYKGKSEITIYDIEELLKISEKPKDESYDESYDFLEMLYMVLGAEEAI